VLVAISPFTIGEYNILSTAVLGAVKPPLPVSIAIEALSS